MLISDVSKNLEAKFKITLMAVLLATSYSTFAKMGKKGIEKKSPYYISGTFFGSEEQHYALGFKIPVYKGSLGKHSLAISTKESKLDYTQIREVFFKNNFYTTSFSYNVRKRRGDGYMPWVSSVSYSLYGYQWFESNQNVLGFRLMTGHKNDGSSWRYGVSLSDQGAFRGVPMPFFVYSTVVWGQHLRAGFPFLSLSGPKENIWNYKIEASPLGITMGGIRLLNDRSKLSLMYILKADSYLLDLESFDERESLLIKKQLVSLKYSTKFFKRLGLNIAVGREFQRSFFKGKNILQKDEEEYYLSPATFFKLGINLGF